MPVLITAGATRNPVDAVRVLTARSSGRTGVAIGEALAARGRAVRVLGNPEACLRAEAAGLVAEEYDSTRDLMARMERWVRENPAGAVVHAAAVGDYELERVEAGKIPSGRDRLVLELVRAPKIVDRLRGWGLVGPLASFKAAPPETGDAELVAIAAAQRARTGSTVVFANVLGRLHRGIALVGEEVRWFDERDEAIAALVERL